MDSFEDVAKRVLEQNAERMRQLEEHKASCRAERCVTCDRAPCNGCGVPTKAHGYVLGSLCDACRAKKARQTRMAPVLASIPEKFSAVTLDAPWLAKLVGPSAMDDARAIDGNSSVVFVGPPGSGKTSLAIAMFRRVVEAAAAEGPMPLVGLSRRSDGLTHRVYSAHALAKARAFHPLGDGEAPAVLAALNADLLLLDELGGEDARYASAVTEVIYERHAQMRPTWITTGVDPKAIATRYGGGIARRVFEEAKLFQLGARR